MRQKSIPSITTALCFIIGASTLFADNSIVTEKKDYYGRKKSVVKDCSGRKTGEIITEKPDYFGRQKSVIKDNCGRIIGTAETSKPDYYGRKNTKVEGASPIDGLR